MNAAVTTLFVVERRLPGVTRSQLALLQTAVAYASRRLTARGEPVRYLRCTFLPDQQRSICLFEAVNAEAVRKANENAQARFTAIEAALEVPPPIAPGDD